MHEFPSLLLKNPPIVEKHENNSAVDPERVGRNFLSTYAPNALIRTYFGVSSLKGVNLSRGFSHFFRCFFAVFACSGRTFCAEAEGLLFEYSS
jgi:hypothetical protein